MNQIENLCRSLSDELSSMRCPDCGELHSVDVSPLRGESLLSPSFPTLVVGIDASADSCGMYRSKVQAIVSAARKDLMKRNGLL